MSNMNYAAVLFLLIIFGAGFCQCSTQKPENWTPKHEQLKNDTGVINIYNKDIRSVNVTVKDININKSDAGAGRKNIHIKTIDVMETEQLTGVNASPHETVRTASGPFPGRLFQPQAEIKSNSYKFIKHYSTKHGSSGRVGIGGASGVGGSGLRISNGVGMSDGVSMSGGVRMSGTSGMRISGGNTRMHGGGLGINGGSIRISDKTSAISHYPIAHQMGSGQGISHGVGMRGGVMEMSERGIGISDDLQMSQSGIGINRGQMGINHDNIGVGGINKNGGYMAIKIGTKAGSGGDMHLGTGNKYEFVKHHSAKHDSAGRVGMSGARGIGGRSLRMSNGVGMSGGVSMSGTSGMGISGGNTKMNEDGIEIRIKDSLKTSGIAHYPVTHYIGNVQGGWGSLEYGPDNGMLTSRDVQEQSGWNRPPKMQDKLEVTASQRFYQTHGYDAPVGKVGMSSVHVQFPPGAGHDAAFAQYGDIHDNSNFRKRTDDDIGEDTEDAIDFPQGPIADDQYNEPVYLDGKQKSQILEISGDSYTDTGPSYMRTRKLCPDASEAPCDDLDDDYKQYTMGTEELNYSDEPSDESSESESIYVSTEEPEKEEILEFPQGDYEEYSQIGASPIISQNFRVAVSTIEPPYSINTQSINPTGSLHSSYNPTNSGLMDIIFKNRNKPEVGFNLFPLAATYDFMKPRKSLERYQIPFVVQAPTEIHQPIFNQLDRLPFMKIVNQLLLFFNQLFQSVTDNSLQISLTDGIGALIQFTSQLVEPFDAEVRAMLPEMIHMFEVNWGGMMEVINVVGNLYRPSNGLDIKSLNLESGLPDAITTIVKFIKRGIQFGITILQTIFHIEKINFLQLLLVIAINGIQIVVKDLLSISLEKNIPMKIDCL